MTPEQIQALLIKQKYREYAVNDVGNFPHCLAGGRSGRKDHPEEQTIAWKTAKCTPEAKEILARYRIYRDGVINPDGSKGFSHPPMETQSAVGINAAGLIGMYHRKEVQGKERDDYNRTHLSDPPWRRNAECSNFAYHSAGLLLLQKGVTDEYNVCVVGIMGGDHNITLLVPKHHKDAILTTGMNGKALPEGTLAVDPWAVGMGSSAKNALAVPIGQFAYAWAMDKISVNYQSLAPKLATSEAEAEKILDLQQTAARRAAAVEPTAESKVEATSTPSRSRQPPNPMVAEIARGQISEPHSVSSTANLSSSRPASLIPASPDPVSEYATQLALFKTNLDALKVDSSPNLIQLQTQGNRLITFINFVPEAEKAKGLVQLTDILKGSNKVLENIDNPEQTKKNVEDLGKGLENLPGKAGFWKKLARGAAAFCCAALVVAGVLLAIPTGGLGALAAAAGMSGLAALGIGVGTAAVGTVGMGVATYKAFNADSGVAKSFADFKSAAQEIRAESKKPEPQSSSVEAERDPLLSDRSTPTP